MTSTYAEILGLLHFFVIHFCIIYATIFNLILASIINRPNYISRSQYTSSTVIYFVVNQWPTYFYYLYMNFLFCTSNPFKEFLDSVKSPLTETSRRIQKH